MCVCVCVSGSVVSDSLQPRGLQPTRLLHPWNSPGKNTAVGCHFLLQHIYVYIYVNVYFKKIFISIMVYHRILNIVLCYTLGPCCLSTLQLISVNLKLPTPCLPQPSPPWQLPVCSVSDCFIDRLICVIFYTPYISDTIWYLPFSFPFTSLSMIISSCTHVGANGIISFFMAE